MAKKRKPTKEQIYDAQINPLMAQIIAICKANKIAVVADFALEEDLHCTTALLDDSYEPSEGQLAAVKELYNKPPRVTMLTIRDGSGKVVASEVIVS